MNPKSYAVLRTIATMRFILLYAAFLLTCLQSQADEGMMLLASSKNYPQTGNGNTGYSYRPPPPVYHYQQPQSVYHYQPPQPVYHYQPPQPVYHPVYIQQHVVYAQPKQQAPKSQKNVNQTQIGTAYHSTVKPIPYVQKTSSRPIGYAAGGPHLTTTPAEAWIIQHESGGNPYAANASSTAKGIGQLLVVQRVAFGKVYNIDPNTKDYNQQLQMMRGYIKQTYGTAEKAEAFWKIHHHY